MKRAVICFTRVPLPGQTKTRLLPLLSPNQCAQLHWAFLRDLSEVYRDLDADLFVSYTDHPNWVQLAELFSSACAFFPQSGVDLGEKMHNALLTVLEKGYDSVVLTGTDLPLLGKEHFYAAFDLLEQQDIVLGPTTDGGYYLVGCKAACPALFQKQEYGFPSVYENTLAAAKTAGYTVGTAPICSDVDTPEDLRQLLPLLSPDSHTYKFLQNLKQEGVL